MSPSNLRVFVGCVFPAPRGHDAAGFAHAHGAVDELIERVRHVHVGEVAWDAGSVEDALEGARALLSVVPHARMVMDVGEVAVELTRRDGLRVLSEASRRLAAHLHAHTTPGVFVTRRLLGTCDASTLDEWTTHARGELIELTAREESTWAELAPSVRLAACLRWVERGVGALEDQGQPERLAELAARYDLIMKTLVSCRAEAPAECARILVDLSRWLRPLWLRPEAVTVCAALLAEPDGLGRELVDGLRLLRGMQLRRLLVFDEALAILTTLMEDAEADVCVRAYAAAEFGAVSLIVKRVEQGRRGYTRADALAESVGSHAARSRAQRGLAVVEMLAAREMSPEADARINRHLELAVELAYQANDRQEVMLSIGERAGLLAASDAALARERMREVLALATQLALPHQMCSALSILTDLELQRGRVDAAKAHLERVSDVLEGSDQMGRWSFTVRQGLVALFTYDVDAADRALATLTELEPHLDHPLVHATNMEFALMLAVVTRRTERVESLRQRQPPFKVRWLEISALADAFGASDAERAGALDALTTILLREHEEVHYHDEWFELIWRHALAVFPHELTSRRHVPTITVSRCGGWFISHEGERVDIAHRPYLHRLFVALVEHHTRGDDGGLDPFELFAIGWPGQTITYSAMKNRVYVGVANLRALGLKAWLLKGVDGYALSPELSIVRLRD